MSVSARFDDLASRHFDAALNADEERELARLLAESAEARAAFRQLARLEGAAAFLGAAGALSAEEALGAEQAPSSTRARAAAPRRTRRQSSIAWWKPLAVAAALICALILGLRAARPESEPEVRVSACAAGDTIVRDGVDAPASVGAGLRAGDGLRSSGALAIAWLDGTTVAFKDGASATLARDRAGKRIALGAGELAASIAHQPSAEPMVFATAQGEAQVVGTRLRLATSAAQTRLEVDEGVVRLSTTSGATEVHAGDAAIAEGGAARLARMHVATVEELERAVAAAASGSTIVVAPGDYRLRQPLLINGVDSVTLRGEGPAAGVRISGGGTLPCLVELGACTDVTVSDLTLSDASEHLVLCHGSDGCVRPHLAHLRLAGAAANFVRVLGAAAGADTGGTIDDCDFAMTRPVSAEGFVAYVDINGGRGWRVGRCRFGAMGETMNVASGVLARAGAADTVCERSVFIDCRRGVTFGSGPAEQRTDHAGGTIRNNMIVRHAGVAGDAGISVNDSPRTRVLHNTVLLAGTYPDAIEYRFPRADGVIVANNLVDAAITARDSASATLTGNVTEAQREWFVDPDRGDLHLRATAAPAIDHGVSVEGCTDDIDGEARPRGAAPDAGADEAR